MNRKNRFKNLMLTKLITKLIVTNISIIIVYGILYLAGILINNNITWTGNETIYIILKVIELNFFWVVVGTCMIFSLVIVIIAWRKSLGYLDEILVATENIYNSDNDLIKLPEELNDVETKMNQIKLNVKENQRLAKEAEQRKNDLIVYLAHDLKTPLTSVIGYLTLLHDEKEISQDTREKYLDIALNKAERLEELINEFFEITRFNLSKLTLELSSVNLSRMLQQLIYEFKPMLEPKNLTCTLSVEPDLMIKCDVDKIKRVLDNLLRNAVNYSFENSNIEINVLKDKEKTVLVFKNQGNTIPKEKLNRIFEQFYRLDSSRGTSSGGAGLGLAIAKQIVELHNGTIKASSDNENIIFEIIVPSL